MPATQGSRTLSTGPVPSNSSAIDHASICINSIGNRDGVKSTRARRCARENGFVGRRSPRPRTGTTFRPVHCDHSGEPGAVRACGRELWALQISGRVVSGERARQGDRFPCARAALRRRFGSSCFPWPTADGAWLPRWVATGLWFVDTARPLGRSVPTWRSDLRDRVGRHAHPSWDMQDACGPPFAFGASCPFGELRDGKGKR